MVKLYRTQFPKEDPTLRFLKHIEKMECCWLWTGTISLQGYGAFKYDGKRQSAHRVSYKLFKGEMPSNLIVRHKCDNRGCVNPDHLILGSSSDNYKDAIKRGRVKLPPRFPKGYISLGWLNAKSDRRYKEVTMNKKETKEELKRRLLTHVDKTENCWIWRSVAGKPHRYGSMGINGKDVKAHRLSYELFIGPIPKGYGVHHHCDNPACVNPKHLYVGTPKDNVRDTINRNRIGVQPNKGFKKISDPSLSEVDVLKIREMFFSGVTVSSLSRYFNLSEHKITMIVRGKWYPDTYVSEGWNYRKREKTPDLIPERWWCRPRPICKIPDETIKEFIELRKQGTTTAEIGKRFNVNQASVSRCLCRVSVRSKKKRINAETINKIVKMRKSGLKPKRISIKLKASYSGVTKCLREHGFNPEIPRPCGEKNWNTNFTNRDVKLMRKLYMEGKSLVEIAEQFKITRQGAYGIVTRRRWKHLPKPT